MQNKVKVPGECFQILADLKLPLNGKTLICGEEGIWIEYAIAGKTFACQCIKGRLMKVYNITSLLGTPLEIDEISKMAMYKLCDFTSPEFSSISDNSLRDQFEQFLRRNFG